MKVAVLGNGIGALEVAAWVYAQGGQVVLFADGPLLINIKKSPVSSIQIPWRDLVQADYHHLISQYDLSLIPTQEQYRCYLMSLEEFLLPKIKLCSGRVDSVQKRFVGINEESWLGKSRFMDLFRVIYWVDGKKIINESEENKDFYKNLSSDLLVHLANDSQRFEDVDIVIDANQNQNFKSAINKTSLPTLGEEEQQKNNKIFYGFYNIFFNKEIWSDWKNLLVVGYDDAQSLYFLDDLMKKKAKVYLFGFDENCNDPLWNEIYQKQIKNFDTIAADYKVKLNEWRDLEDYMKAKIKMPEVPEKQLEILKNAHICSIDKMMGQENLFVTVENYTDDVIKTINIDGILVLNSKSNKPNYKMAIQQNEKGFFNFNLGDEFFCHQIGQLKLKLQDLETKFKILFSKVDL